VDQQKAMLGVAVIHYRQSWHEIASHAFEPESQ